MAFDLEDMKRQTDSGVCSLIEGTSFYLYEVIDGEDDPILRLFDAEARSFSDVNISDFTNLSFSSHSMSKLSIDALYYEANKDSVGFGSSAPKDNVSLEEKEKIKTKVLKLLNLAKANTNIEEAKNAILQAQRLMYKYGVNVSDYYGEFGELKEDQKNVVVRRSPYMDFAQWKYNLMVTIADNFRCRTWFNGRSSGRASFAFFGLEHEADMAVELFNFAINISIDSCEIYIKQRKAEEKKKENKAIVAFEVDRYDMPFMTYESHFHTYYQKPDYFQLRLNYFNGFVDGLRDSFIKQSQELSLVLVTDALVVQEYDKRKIKNVTLSRKTAVRKSDYDSRQKGYERGKSLSKDTELN